MLYKETVATETLDLIKELCADENLSDFHLVGGTALSLQIGHRISVDIDLFTNQSFDSKKLSSYLESAYDLKNTSILTNGIFTFINDIKVDFITHQYPWLKDPVTEEGIRMVSKEDIGAMKLNAITGNGTRYKDFVDVYFILEHLPLSKMLYHQDIVKSKIDFIANPITFEHVTGRLREAVIKQDKLFAKSEHKKSKRQGRGI